MDKLGEFIVPLIIVTVVIIQFIAKLAKAAKQQQQPPPAERQRPAPVRRQPPAAPPRNEWEDLLEALGQQDADDEHPILVPPPVTVSAPPPLPPLPVSQTEGGDSFVRVSDFASRPLDQIDERAFEVQRNIAEKFTEKETNITPVAAPTVSGDHRTAHPIRARFRSRQSIREAVIMSEILGSPLAMRS